MMATAGTGKSSHSLNPCNKALFKKINQTEGGYISSQNI